MKLPKTSPKIEHLVATLLQGTTKLEAHSNSVAMKFHEQCKQLGIAKPPTLHLSHFWPAEAALTDHNAILLGSSFLNHPTEVQQFALFHELAHILRNDRGSSKKATEFATDTLALQIIGSKVGAIGLVRHAEQSFNADLNAHLLPETSLTKRWVNKIISAGKNAQLKRQYGTFEQRVNNIEATPLDDTSHVERLVAQHNKRSFLALP